MLYYNERILSNISKQQKATGAYSKQIKASKGPFPWSHIEGAPSSPTANCGIHVKSCQPGKSLEIMKFVWFLFVCLAFFRTWVWPQFQTSTGNQWFQCK